MCWVAFFPAGERVVPGWNCFCGVRIPLGDIPCPHEWDLIRCSELVSRRAESVAVVFQSMRELVVCPACCRVWVFWAGYGAPPQLYEPRRADWRGWSDSSPSGHASSIVDRGDRLLTSFRCGCGYPASPNQRLSGDMWATIPDAEVEVYWDACVEDMLSAMQLLVVCAGCSNLWWFPMGMATPEEFILVRGA